VSFYAELGESLEPARAVCAGCLVRDECLDPALDHQERYGLWGGKSWRERQANEAAAPGELRTGHLPR
jgi:WhiB family redox-sensing transcriptional regulator